MRFGINIIDFFRKKQQAKRKIIELPTDDVFKCEIETPQFNGRTGEVKYMFKQTGTFYVSDMKFIHDNMLNGHDVQFHSMDDFKSSLIRLL